MFVVTLVATACAAAASPAQEQKQQPATPAARASRPATSPKSTDAGPKTEGASPASAATLAGFKARVDEYLNLRKKATKDAPPLKETSDPAKIKMAQETLAGVLRAERSTAHPGDIFTPDVQAVFRKLLAPELKGEDGQDAKKVMKDDAVKDLVLKVNANYPEGKPLPSVPSNLLLSLPSLPKELEYRIIGKNLILRDTGANIIVDFIPNAIK